MPRSFGEDTRPFRRAIWKRCEERSRIAECWVTPVDPYEVDEFFG
jgi:hypothetical protein